jgi:hypothetical protein
MGTIRQFRNPKLSLWQSAADAVAVERMGAAGRADLEDAIIGAVNELAARIESGQDVPRLTSVANPNAMDLSGAVLYCARLAMALGEAKASARARDVERLESELDPESGPCDTDWMKIAEKYAARLVFALREVPYRRHTAQGDFVIGEELPADARLAVVSQLGTGVDGAARVMRQIAAKKPSAVIHLGDIYYSGVSFEVERYFLAPLREHLDPAGIRCFSLCGNHDAYSGGAGYYETLLPALSQPASYFCLRNDDWQFIGLDTGLHDRIPGRGPTYLEDSEVEWLGDKVRNSGRRQTVLLSHHQLFSAYESIADTYYNESIYGQLSDLLDSVALWFWGHEHRLAIYETFDALKPGLARARSLGRGTQYAPSETVFPEVRVKESAHLKEDVYGYAIVELKGAGARVEYYLSTDENKPVFHETLGAAALRAG